MTDEGLPLSVRDLSVYGDRGRMILSVPALDVPQGTALGIRGPSGAGKSTLLYALAGLVDRCDGQVLWGGEDLLALRPEARAGFRASRIGMIFQDFLLFDEMDPGGNAAIKALFAPRDARPALRRGALTGLARLGLGEPEGRAVASFSGGERQRISVARALSADPPVLLADEPTASLHRAAADALIDDLLSVVAARRRTMIVVSHDERLLERMDRVIDIRDGALVVEGAAS